MLTNYIKAALRFITKNLSFALINLLGLTAGITVFLLIALFLQDQLSYDKHLPAAARTYRLVGIQEPEGLDKQHVAFTSAAWVPFILENIPQAEEAFRMMYAQSQVVEIGEKLFNESSSYFSEGRAIHYMGLEVINGGDPARMLKEPNQAAISRIMAEKFYGTTDVIGNTFKIADETFAITGVFENDHIQSHMEINILLSFSTVDPETPFLMHFGNNTLATYIVAKEGTHPQHIADMINDHQQKLMDEEQGSIMPNTYYLQEAGDIFLRSGHIKFHMRTHQGNINNIYIFSIVALLILFIACINFINLATAYSTRRAKEVGLRKVLGASRSKLALQFTGESFILTFFAIIIALGLIEFLLPYYNTLLGTELKIDFVGNYIFNIGLLGLLLIVGFISGFYPALYISRFQPGYVLKAGSASGQPSSALLRKVLVIFQFAISTAMILATSVVIHQVNHMQQKDLGYNPEQVISVFIRQTSDYEQIRSFRNQLLNHPEIVSAGISSGHNGVAGRQSVVTTTDSVPVNLMVRYGYTDPDFFPTMQIQVSEGRNFSHEYATDPFQTIIINRATQRALGWEDPIGKRFVNNDDEEYDFFTVVGVIEDYHYYSLHNAIEPAVYIWRPGQMSVINLRHNTSDKSMLMQKIEQEYASFFPGKYFQAHHLSDLLNRQYRNESNIMKIFLAFAIFCILISCLGLYGLTSFSVNQKRKEISIRKVLGGSILQINLMLLLGFLRWIIVAAVIALPLTWFFMDDWLNNYAYRVSIGWWHLGFTLLIILSIAASTILMLSTRAAMQNPATAIKYE